MTLTSIIAAAVLEGPFPLLCTPWTESAELDVPVLVKEAKYVNDAGAGGIVWPTAPEVDGLDETGEFEKGLTALAEASVAEGFIVRLTAVCSASNTECAVSRIRRVDAIARATGAKMAVLARPPDDAKDDADMERHYRALAKETALPIVIQTYNGKSPQPSVELLVRLAEEFPENLGYVKEESPGLQVNGRMERLVAEPAIKTVFSGWGGKGWVYQATQIGTRGVISQRAAYAPLFVKIWRRAKDGADASDSALADAYAKYLYMANLGDIFSKWGDDEMRGPHLYVLERLGIFRNRLTRTGKGKVEDFEVTDGMRAELDARIRYVFGAREAEVPYAFGYAGSAATWIDASAPARTLEDNDSFTKTVREWKSPDGKLVLRSTEKTYKRFPAREYLPELVCASDAPTEIVDGFRSARIVRRAAGATLRALRGTIGNARDFEPVTVKFGDASGGATNAFSLVAWEGRSSAQWMPWMGFDFPDGTGLEVALGWSGAWRADCMLGKGEFALSAGMVKTHFRLLPGETLRQPSVIVFTRAADVTPAAMQTLIHRFMLDEKCPRDAKGALIKPILPITAGGGNKTPGMMRKIIDWSVANRMPFDCFWVDAGWNGPAHTPDLLSNCGDRWQDFVGDWRFNPTVHPDGNLAKIADAAHEAGMRMLLWVEPERCVSDPAPPLFKEHRDWLLPARDDQIRDKRRLNVNLGNPAAREWAIETISSLVRENKLDIYRQDFNMNTLPLWQKNDAPDRQGVTEAKYVAGLYEFWDTLRARFPHLIIENCASGGRRLDFEAVSRSHSYCRTDFAVGHRGPAQVVDVQNVTVNTLAYQPFQGSETTPAAFFDDYGFFSSVCAGSVFTPSDWNAGIVKNDFTPEQTAWFRKVFAVADRMRPFFEGDFYPLTDMRASVDGSTEVVGKGGERRWCAYQMHRTDLASGFVLAFRRAAAPDSRLACELGGIDESAEYEVESYGGDAWKMSGAELKRLVVELPEPRSFRLLFYRRGSRRCGVSPRR